MNTKLNNIVKRVPLEKGYVVSKFRESRSEASELTYLAGDSRIAAIRGMPVYNVESHQVELL